MSPVKAVKVSPVLLCRVTVIRVLAVKVERVMLRLRGVGKLSFGQAVRFSYVQLRYVLLGKGRRGSWGMSV